MQIRACSGMTENQCTMRTSKVIFADKNNCTVVQKGYENLFKPFNYICTIFVWKNHFNLLRLSNLNTISIQYYFFHHQEKMIFRPLQLPAQYPFCVHIVHTLKNKKINIFKNIHLSNNLINNFVFRSSFFYMTK